MRIFERTVPVDRDQLGRGDRTVTRWVVEQPTSKRGCFTRYWFDSRPEAEEKLRELKRSTEPDWLLVR
jgi:hypothetical protein